MCSHASFTTSPPELRTDLVPMGEGIEIGVALSREVYYLECEILQCKKPAGCFAVCIPMTGQRPWGGMVGHEGDPSALQIIAEPLYGPFYGQGFLLNRCIALLHGG